jgi:uncharacterized cupredoxin-like copper-binding protein
MHRSLYYFAAFTGMGAIYAITMLLVALVLGAAVDPTAGAGQASPSGTPGTAGPVGTIEVHAFDLGFEPAIAHVSAAGIYRVTFVNDGGTLHDLTFADGTKIEAAAHTTATGQVTIPAAGLSFICSVPGHADGGMRGEVMVSGGLRRRPRHRCRSARRICETPTRRARPSSRPRPRAGATRSWSPPSWATARSSGRSPPR